MFSHVMIGVNDLDVSKKFYDATLGALGIKPGLLSTRLTPSSSADVHSSQ